MYKYKRAFLVQSCFLFFFFLYIENKLKKIVSRESNLGGSFKNFRHFKTDASNIDHQRLDMYKANSNQYGCVCPETDGIFACVNVSVANELLLISDISWHPWQTTYYILRFTQIRTYYGPTAWTILLPWIKFVNMPLSCSKTGRALSQLACAVIHFVMWLVVGYHQNPSKNTSRVIVCDHCSVLNSREVSKLHCFLCLSFL